MKTRNSMKRILAILLCLAMLLSITSVFALAAEIGTIYGEEQTIKIDNSLGLTRETNFNAGWKFYLGTSGTAQNPGFNDSDWTTVTLPHDFSIFQNYTASGDAESGFLPGGTGWYRKTFTIPASLEGKTLILNFDGVYSDATVYVNGTQVGEHHYGYTPFAFDITDLVTCDGATENVIAVKAVNDVPTSRWYSGSGIYRDVTMIAVDPVHVALNGTHITTPNIADGNGTINVETEICNDGASAVNATVRQTVFTSDDVQAAIGEGSVYVKAGTVSELFTTAFGTMADGSTVTGTIVWDDVDEEVYGTAGDYTISGTLTFDGEEPLPVKARLHVIANVIALRNVSTVTGANTEPTLPNVVNGVLADGTVTGKFIVTWEAFDASDFVTVDDIVIINGIATIIGDKILPVTASVRVAEQVNTESVNVGTSALSVTQDIPQGYWSDNLASVNNGVTKSGDNTNERWTNWNYRTRSAEATLTFTWATAQMLESVNPFYYYDNCCAYPESIEFSYSLNGEDYIDIDVTTVQEETYYLGAQYSYTFDQPINPVGVKIKFTQQNGTTGAHCVGVTEAEFMTFAGTIEYNSSALLSSIIVDNAELDSFNGDTFTYEAKGEEVEAASSVNAGITILPALDGVVRILTISEDGSSEYIYDVTLTSPCVEISVGNVNMDGIITNADVVTIARYLVNVVKLNAEQLAFADYDENGLVNNSDLIKLAKSIVK